jgi:hypothetical protein
LKRDSPKDKVNRIIGNRITYISMKIYGSKASRVTIMSKIPLFGTELWCKSGYTCSLHRILLELSNQGEHYLIILDVITISILGTD